MAGKHIDFSIDKPNFVQISLFKRKPYLGKNHVVLQLLFTNLIFIFNHSTLCLALHIIAPAINLSHLEY